MGDFNRKVEETTSRVGKSVGETTERLEKEANEFIKYLNDEVVPAVRQHSTKALRVASQKCRSLLTTWTSIRLRPQMTRLPLLFLSVRVLSSCSHKPTRVAVAPPPPVQQDQEQPPIPEGTPPSLAEKKQQNPPENSPSPESRSQP